MKRILITLFMLVSIDMYAQYDTVPHNIGIPNYFMNQSFDSLSVKQHDDAGCLPRLYSIAQAWNEHGVVGTPWNTPAYADSGDFAFGFFPDSTVNVIGVAWAVWLYGTNYGDYTNWLWDSIVVKLFHPSGDRMSTLCYKTITRDTFIYNKVIDYRLGWSELDSVVITQGGMIRSTPDPIYEVFFGDGYIFTDSLYISVKLWKEGSYNNLDMTQGYAEWHSRGGVIPFVYPIQSYRMKDTPGDDDPWTYGEMHAYPLLFPIIRLDGDTCPEVREVRYTRVGNSAAIAQWDAGTNHRDWQLCYGPQGFDPEGADVVNTTVPQRALTGLTATGRYDVYVKARCRFARDEWTPWAGPFSFSMSEIGIEDGPARVEFSVTPNPAHGNATVRCEAGLHVVEVVSATGATVLSLDGGGAQACVLDLAGLAKGVYVVRIATPLGTAAQKLAVE
jgi:hypothetical protein